MEDIISYQLAQMTEKMGKINKDADTENINEYIDGQIKIQSEDDSLVGYVPETFNIWVPPRQRVVEDTEIDSVLLEGEGCGKRLVFFVPKDWVTKNIKADWQTRLNSIGWTKKEDTSSLLDQFIELAEADPKKTERFLEFARNWGPLWEQNPKTGAALDQYNLAPWVESIEVWRLNAIEVKILIRIAALLHQNELASINDWKTLYIPPENLVIIALGDEKGEEFIEKRNTFFDNKENDRSFYSLDKQREELMNYVNFKIISEYGVKLFIIWRGEDPELIISPKLGFINAVWYQLIQAIARNNCYICSGCSKIYLRIGKRPKKGQKNYCVGCGSKASKKNYARKKRKAESEND